MSELPNECPGCGKAIYLQTTKKWHLSRCEAIGKDTRDELLDEQQRIEKVVPDV